MKFDKKVKRERREFLEREYNDFIKNNRVTKKEKQELRNWIMHGESVYSNSLDVCNAYFEPLNYIEFIRMESKHSCKGTYNTDTDDVMFVVDDEDDIDI